MSARSTPLHIIIEGMNCVGKSTFAKALVSALNKQGRVISGVKDQATHLVEPTAEARELITGSYKYNLPAASAMMIMADRLIQYQTKTLPAIKSGRYVVQERGHLSTDVYQGIIGKQRNLINQIVNASEQLRECANSGDMLIYLHAAPEVIVARMNARNEGTHGHATDASFIEETCKAYEACVKRMKQQKVVSIDVSHMTIKELEDTAWQTANTIELAKVMR